MSCTQNMFTTQHFLERYILGDAVRCREYPLGADQGAATEVLVQRVYERNLAIIWQ